MDSSKDGRFEKVAASELTIGEAMATGEEIRSLRQPNLDVSLDLFDLGPIDQRPDVDRRVQARANSDGRGIGPASSWVFPGRRTPGDTVGIFWTAWSGRTTLGLAASIQE